MIYVINMLVAIIGVCVGFWIVPDTTPNAQLAVYAVNMTVFGINFVGGILAMTKGYDNE